ncbi:MAG: hypothetical protein LAP87_17950 [Acidobacteriia bacterium]|nr:hypothetical protein [Terriglobia bacterium]
MASPPIPPSLDHLSVRPFSFYPAILNVEHNEWLFRKATWSEILVVNCKSGIEIWIPRRFVGEVSRIDDPVRIVGLNRELELRSGMVMPYQRRVIEMPVAVGYGAAAGPAADRGGPAAVVGIRLESSDKRILKLIGSALTVAIVLYLLAVNLTRVSDLRQRVTYTAADQSFLELSRHDDYVAVKQKLGEPASDRWTEVGTIQFRALSYPSRKYTVILMGADRPSAVYVGAMDENWKPISGGDAASLLRSLRRF